MLMKKINWLQTGGKIAEMRRSRDMTQQQLAELTGLSDVYIGYLEQGKRHGTMDTYLLIVNVLGFTMDDLLNEYLDQHVRVMATDIESQMAGCEPREQDLILHMVQEMLIFFREKG